MDFPKPITLAGLFLFFTLGTQAQVRAVIPANRSTQPNRIQSPGVDAGDYLYVSAQGPRRPDGSLPATFADQVRQSLANIKSVVEAAGLTMQHVVYTQVYLEDISKYPEMDQAFKETFGKAPPARAVLGVAAVPGGVVQINAVAVHNLSDRKAVFPPNYKSEEAVSPGILTSDRLFVSGMMGSDPASGKVPDDPAAQVDFALDRMKAVLEAAGLDLRNMVFVNPYLTSAIPAKVMNEHYAQRFEFGNTPARATIQVSSLPGGTHIEYTGVAVRDLKQRQAIRPQNMPPSPTASPCVFAGETLYCSAKSGFIPGPHGGVFATTTTHQLRQTMRNQLDNFEQAGMNFDQVVSANVWLDNLSDTTAFDEVYAEYFSGTPPARTTVAQIPPTERKPEAGDHYPDLEQVSFIAIRKPSAK
jgi:2-iminobutanoate/2-iminopropanoate deaminase